jgi:hypothetical protein
MTTSTRQQTTSNAIVWLEYLTISEKHQLVSYSCEKRSRKWKPTEKKVLQRGHTHGLTLWLAMAPPPPRTIDPTCWKQSEVKQAGVIVSVCRQHVEVVECGGDGDRWCVLVFGALPCVFCVQPGFNLVGGRVSHGWIYREGARRFVHIYIYTTYKRANIFFSKTTPQTYTDKTAPPD